MFLYFLLQTGCFLIGVVTPQRATPPKKDQKQKKRQTAAKHFNGTFFKRNVEAQPREICFLKTMLNGLEPLDRAHSDKPQINT